MKTRLRLSAIALTQVLHTSNRFMSQSLLGSTLKKSFLLLSAVVTLGLVASPAKADHMPSPDSTDIVGTTGIGTTGIDTIVLGSAAVPTTTAPVTSSLTEVAVDEVTAESNTPEAITAATTGVEPTVAEEVLTEDTTTISIELVSTESVSTQAIDSVSSEDLVNESAAPETRPTSVEIAQSPTTPDTTDVTPGRTTRSSSSYIGVGGNIGLGDGDTALGESSFAVFSKIGLTSNISARPGVLFSDDPTILLPLTLDFASGDTDPSEDVSEDIGISLNPYIGAGIAISTGGDGAVDLLATGGIDVPFSSRFTGTAAVNATFFDNIAVGLLLGVGYNF